jgi:AraC-like DNA-binding protein
MGHNLREHFSFKAPHPLVYSIPQFIRIGRLEGPQRYVKEEHPHQENEWILIKSGYLKVWIDGIPIEAAPGDLYFVQPGQTHREESVKGPLDFYALRFLLHDLRGKPTYFIPPPGKPQNQLLKKSDRKFLELFEHIFKEVWAMILQMIWMLRRQLNLLHTEDPKRTTHRQQVLVEHARQYIMNDLKRTVPLAELGKACGASPDHLRHVFKELTGLSPVQFSMSLRMNEAKRLLSDLSLPIYTIAERVGFPDPYYFSRQFKKFTGKSPVSFRKPPSKKK